MAKRPLSSAVAAEVIGGKRGLLYSIAWMIAIRAGTTASTLAAELGVPAGRIRHQLRNLIRLGVVETVEETARRGVVERSYALAGDLILDDEEFDALPPEGKARIVNPILKGTVGDIARSVKAGLISRRSDRCVARTPILVDEEGWKQLARLHARTLDEVCRVRVESEQRLSEGDAEPIRTVSVLLFIEMP